MQAARWRACDALTFFRFKGFIEEHFNGAARASLRLLHPDPFICVIDDFLSLQACGEVIAYVEGSSLFGRSLVLGGQQGNEEVSTERTSSSAFIPYDALPRLSEIRQRATELCGFPETHFENLQVVRYSAGQEYQPHVDFFVPTRSSDRLYLAKERGGQRCVTLLAYLNDINEADGGATVFSELGNKQILGVQPQAGRALFWYNVLHGSRFDAEDWRTWHAGSPVRREGCVKYAINIWIRNFPVR